MPEMTDIVTVDGNTDLLSAQFLNRDCAFPIMKIEKTLRKDEVLAQMPIYFGFWEDDTILPIILDQTFDVDTSVVISDCDVATVSGDVTQGELVAPNMRQFKLGTVPLQIHKLVPKFCKGRNILPDDRRTLLNSDGSINMGNPYAVDFARFVFSLLARPFTAIVSDRVLAGDESEDFGVDGLYTQLENGWVQGTPTVPAYLNQAIQIDWGLLTGAYEEEDPAAAGLPDDRTISGQTIDLWGETVDVPVDYNLAQFLNDFLFPAIKAHWGEPDSYEIHVEPGKTRCFVRSAACLKPCDEENGIWDTSLRERYAELDRRQVVQLYPSGTELAMLESPKVAENVMWIGPRSMNGNPTYAAFFRDMDEMYAAAGAFGDIYGQGSGLPSDTEPLLTDIVNTLDIPFEGRAVRQDLRKISIDCVEASVMAFYGVLAFERHLWIKVSNIDCPTYVEKMTSGVRIDSTPVETHV